MIRFKSPIPGTVILLLLGMLYGCGQKRAGSIWPTTRDKQEQRAQADTLLSRALRYVYRPGIEGTDMDSAMLLVHQAEVWNADRHDSIIQARIYYLCSNVLHEKGDTARGHRYIDSAIALLEQTASWGYLGDAYMEQSGYFSDFSSEYSMHSKEHCFEKAGAAFEKAGLKERQAYALKNMGDMRLIFGGHEQAMADLRKALAIYSSIDYKNLHGIYDLLGYISNGIGDCPTAISYGLLAVRTAESVNDTTMQLCTIYNRLALAYNNQHMPAEAELYWGRAIDIAIRYRDRTAVYGILPNYSLSMLSQGKWQEAVRRIRYCEAMVRPVALSDTIRLSVSYTNAYMAGSRNAEAKPYADNLMRILRGRDQRGFYIEPAYRALIHYFQVLGQYKEAGRYASDYIAFSTANDYTMGQSMAYQLKSQTDSAEGRYHDALIYYYMHKHLHDSMGEQSKKMQIAQLQVQYETEKKDQDLRLKQQDIELLTNKGQLQDANLRKATLLRNVIILAALLLLTIAWIGYRIKQRHNNRLEAQQQEIHGQNEQLKDLLHAQKKLVTEKEWLVREIHHRVKNNLQIIISLLNAQAEFLHDPSALDAIRESRERMQAVALIHQKLYQPDHSTRICMKSYISEMVTYLGSSFADIGRIRFVMDIDEIDLDVSQSVPLGLILNEAITNAIKYAFPAGRQGVITISLKKVSDESILLRVADDGQGFPADFDTMGGTSLGVQLIRLFGEQLDGELSLRSGQGVEVSLLFRHSQTGL